MSGIAGIVRFDGAPVEPGLIESMTAAMSHRGPDGIAHWSKGSVALGQCMLRTTPESLEETQPLANEDASLILVMDGRIDNREELLLEMRRNGVALRGQSDANLVLGAYRLWGEDSPRHLLGDFAFAVWDEHRQHLFCARDHFGVKPFYYFRSAQLLAFASEEEAFFGLPGVTGNPNEDRIAYLLVPSFEAFDFNVSWLRDILKLGAGNSMSVPVDGRVSTRTYWRLESMEELRYKTDAEYEEAFRSVFLESVRCRMRARGNPALMLSGGMDSASVAAAAWETARESPEQAMHTFSVISDHPQECAETRNIFAVARGHEQHAYLASAGGGDGAITDDDLTEAAWSHAHPVDNSLLLPALMYGAARRLGHRGMLDGIDGDLVTHTPVHYQASLLRTGAWREAWQEAKLAAVDNTYQRGLTASEIMARSAWHALAPFWLKQTKFRAERFISAGGFGIAPINPEFAKEIHLAERLADEKSRALAQSRQTDQEKHIQVLTQPGITRGMEGYDRVAARRGIEPRHPWADVRLVEFYVRLPIRQKVRQGWTKYLLRRALAPRLSAEVCWHSGKAHLGAQLTRRVMAAKLNGLGAAPSGELASIERYMNIRWLRDRPSNPDSWQHQIWIEHLFEGLTLARWLARTRKAI